MNDQAERDGKGLWVGRWFTKLGHRLRARFSPTYQDLLEEKAILKTMVLYWKYPNGLIIPPEKRGHYMARLNRLDRRIKRHPDHPGGH